VTLLDESYNANGASVRAALAVLRTMPGRRVAVLGDMLELGSHGRAEHAALAADVAASADLLFSCGGLMQSLFEAVPPPLRGAHAATSAALAPIVAAAVQAPDSVLVKGSLGSRMALVVRALEGVA
jgi:UDP-N-acetylmuramoyl-tripeptide--D-alanyl-D-alanine ligase